MAEILSQSQIDELLNSMNSPADAAPKESQVEVQKQEEQKWRKYDFNSPKKFTKDKLRLLSNIYDNYARLISLRLNGVLRTVVEVEITLVEEQRYFEFNNMLDENDVITTVETKIAGENKYTPVIYYMNPGIMVNMIDRMLGGGDEDFSTIDYSYKYTEIELAIYEKIMSNFVSTTNTTWQNYVTLKTGHEVVEENPMMFQDISLDEAVIIIILSLKMGEVTGNLTVCMPGNIVASIFSEMDSKKFNSNLDEAEYLSTSEMIMKSLHKSTLEVSAVLGGTTLDLQEVYNLQVGDVIDLAKPKDSQVTLCVEGQPWFEGKLGVYNKNSAIQIEKKIAEEVGTE